MAPIPAMGIGHLPMNVIRTPGILLAKPISNTVSMYRTAHSHKEHSLVTTELFVQSQQ